ncbi:uncharacterized protein LOC121889660 [Thunnus maccoyii]|uniref:uncharacterized protein LOC121889660 n=1 Tax=Thunnus maccoyii TaxID=8240 RepID=UPI001C4DCEAB|nr:uncharacterized protein LOC121889660 [Thunnus maccoyii]
MLCVLVPLLLFVVTETSASLSLSGNESASSCPPRWHLFGQRCFAFYPVWSSWSNANSMCSQTGGNLVSLRTPEERQFVSQLANTNTSVWLGGYQIPQNDSWFWSDNSTFRISSWVNQRQKETRVGGACMEMTPKSGELHSATCGELRFYICSKASSAVFPSSSKPVEPGIVPGVSLFDVVWGHSHLLAEEILRSSSFLKEVWSGQLTERCYTSFTQQEAVYLHRVSHTLEALISTSLQGADDMRSLLLDALKRYRSRNQSAIVSPLPKWLKYSLQSFHSVVLEEPVYWLVALSARACLHKFLVEELLLSEPILVSGPEANSFYQQWRRDSMKDVDWMNRYRKVLEKHQDHMDEYQAINIFREHMMNQKSLYRAVGCD